MKEQFDFGLERVRKVRAHDEDRAKEALAASIAHRLRGEAKLQSVSDQIHAAQVSHRDGLAGPDGPSVIDPSALVRRQAYLERLERTRIVAALEVDRAEVEIDARRDVLTGASRKREVLDRLHDRQAQGHALAWGRHQGNLLDEIALQSHTRGRTSTA